MKRKTLSVLLSFVLLGSILNPVTVVRATDDNESGLVLNKTATKGSNGSYTITLEAYATGESFSTTVSQEIPSDIILVLDTSTSMSSYMSSTSYSAYNDRQNRNLYTKRHNGGSGNLWYRSENQYYSVSVEIQEVTRYVQLDTSLKNREGNFMTTTGGYYYYANNLYEKVGDMYQNVTLTQNNMRREYTYTFSDGTSITSSGDDTVPDLGSHAPLYTSQIDSSQTIYTYSYTDSAGKHIIGTSTGANSEFETTLYQKSTSSNVTRLSALKSAANTFANQVSRKALGSDGKVGTDDDVNHRIAVVKFADSATNLTNGLVDMDSTTGLSTVNNAIDKLSANGNTYPSTGLDAANNIFRQNPVVSGQRNRVIVLFTDGYPAPSGTNNINYTLCDNAISSANTSKNTYGATVYTVGIFDGANPNSDISSNYQRGSTDATQQLVAANRYMHYTSSNYPDATSMDSGGTKAKNGYYLSAADADTLTSIFMQISDNVSSGGSSTTLDSSAVIRDIVEPAFQMPANGEDIRLYTASSNGSTNNWSTPEAFNGTVSIDPDTNQISVSGFSFKDNWCGSHTENGAVTFHDGKKLIIQFDVTPKAGFLGGNDVDTNTQAGIYENGSATTPLKSFPKPKVNVPIPVIQVTPEDQNVFLLGTVSGDALRENARVQVGTVGLDLTADNYGLENWQTEYVTITLEIRDGEGNPVTGDLTSLTDDTSYSIFASVSPKETNPTSTVGTKAQTQSGTASAGIHVFKPQLTYKDSTVYYGDTVPSPLDSHLEETLWLHEGTRAEDVSMTGTAPTLHLEYLHDQSGIISTKEDIPVDVAVSIDGKDVTDHTGFLHTICADHPGCQDPDGGRFWLHVKTCQLTVSKSGGSGAESYIFDILKDGAPYTQVTLPGNGSSTIYELPVGSYTIREKEDWSWRYTTNNGTAAVLSASKDTGSIQCINSNPTTPWLNGYSAVATNVYTDVES